MNRKFETKQSLNDAGFNQKIGTQLQLSGTTIIAAGGSIKYAIDASSTYTNRSITDKEYVDSKISSSNLHNEQMIGSVDGNNRIFKTTFPFVLSSLIVFMNGLKERYYSVDSDIQITLETAPINIGFNDIIEVTYMKK
jgi:hypothetical protein